MTGARGDTPQVYAGPCVADVAYACGNREIWRRVVLAGGRPQLHTFVAHHDYAVIGELLHRDHTLGIEILGNAVWNRSVDIVRMCLQHEHVRERLAKSSGELLWAVFYNSDEPDTCLDYSEILEMLLEAGADANAPQAGHRDEPFCQPLHMIAKTGCAGGVEEALLLDFTRLLLDHGADIEAVDRDLKTTPLGYAYYGRPRYLQYLLSRGADVSPAVCDADARPLALAESSPFRECAEILRDWLESAH